MCGMCIMNVVGVVSVSMVSVITGWAFFRTKYGLYKKSGCGKNCKCITDDNCSCSKGGCDCKQYVTCSCNDEKCNYKSIKKPVAKKKTNVKKIKKVK